MPCLQQGAQAQEGSGKLLGLHSMPRPHLLHLRPPVRRLRQGHLQKVYCRGGRGRRCLVFGLLFSQYQFMIGLFFSGEAFFLFFLFYPFSWELRCERLVSFLGLTSFLFFSFPSLCSSLFLVLRIPSIMYAAKPLFFSSCIFHRRFFFLPFPPFFLFSSNFFLPPPPFFILGFLGSYLIIIIIIIAIVILFIPLPQYTHTHTHISRLSVFLSHLPPPPPFFCAM